MRCVKDEWPKKTHRIRNQIYNYADIITEVWNFIWYVVLPYMRIHVWSTMKHRYAQVVIVSIIHVRQRGTNMQGQAGIVVIMTFAQGTRVSEVAYEGMAWCHFLLSRVATYKKFLTCASWFVFLIDYLLNI